MTVVKQIGLGPKQSLSHVLEASGGNLPAHSCSPYLAAGRQTPMTITSNLLILNILPSSLFFVALMKSKRSWSRGEKTLEDTVVIVSAIIEMSLC